METTRILDTSRPSYDIPVVAAASPMLSNSLVGESEAMQRLRLQLKRIGPYFRTALICGEPGTGKSRAAMTLHQAAGLRGEFVSCETALLETASRGGGDGMEMLMALVQSAGSGSAPRGTIFFDRISEASLRVQELLLRWMQRMEVERRGHSDPGIRVIASSHEDLRLLRTMGRFKQELYERLTMVEVRLTPLRERKEDVPALAQHFLAEFRSASGTTSTEIGEEAMRRLHRHTWPGNVRELQGVLHAAVLEARGTRIEAKHLPIFPQATAAPGEQSGGTGLRRLQEVVDEHVLGVMQRCSGNKLRAAETLGVSRSTLYRMLEVAGAGGRDARV